MKTISKILNFFIVFSILGGTYFLYSFLTDESTRLEESPRVKVNEPFEINQIGTANFAVYFETLSKEKGKKGKNYDDTDSNALENNQYHIYRLEEESVVKIPVDYESYWIETDKGEAYWHIFKMDVTKTGTYLITDSETNSINRTLIFYGSALNAQLFIYFSIGVVFLFGIGLLSQSLGRRTSKEWDESK